MNRVKYIAFLMIVIAFASAGLSVNRYLDHNDMIESIPQFCQSNSFVRNTPILIEYEQRYDNIVNNVTFPKEKVMVRLPILVKCNLNISDDTHCRFYDYMIEFNKINSTEIVKGANCTLTCEDQNSLMSFKQTTDWDNNELYTYFECTKLDYYDTGVYLDPSKLECEEGTPDKKDCDKALRNSYGDQVFCFVNDFPYNMEWIDENMVIFLEQMLLGDERTYFRSFLIQELDD